MAELIELEQTEQPEKSNSFLMPSAFEQAEELANSEDFKPFTPQPTEDVTVLEKEDIEVILAMPFDIAAVVTQYEGFGLEKEELEKMCRLFLKPIQRMLPRVKNLDLAIALSSLAGISLEKYLGYQIYNSDKARRERERQNQFNKG